MTALIVLAALFALVVVATVVGALRGRDARLYVEPEWEQRRHVEPHLAPVPRCPECERLARRAHLRAVRDDGRRAS